MFNGIGNAVCDGCGAVHRMTARHVPYNNQDSLNCARCGHELYRWSGGVDWLAELIEPPVIPSHSPRLDSALAQRQERNDNAALKIVFDTASMDAKSNGGPLAVSLPTNKLSR